MIRCVRRAESIPKAAPGLRSNLGLNERSKHESALYKLLETHQRIDGQLRVEQQRRWKDWLRIARLKKLKLRLKDLMHRHTLKPGRA